MNDIILTFGKYEYSLFHNSKFKVKKIENLTWAAADLAATRSPYVDGDTIQNTVGQPRDITVIIKPLKSKGDFDEVMHQFTRMYRRNVKLVWKDKKTYCYHSIGTTNSIKKDWIINGVITDFSSDRFESDVEFSFTIHCPIPYWIIADGISLYSPSGGGASSENWIYTDAPADIAFEVVDFGVYYKFRFEINYVASGALPYSQIIDFWLKDRTLTGDIAVSFVNGKVKAELTSNGVTTDVTSQFDYDYNQKYGTLEGYQNVQQFTLPKLYNSQADAKFWFQCTARTQQGESVGNRVSQLTYYPMFV